MTTGKLLATAGILLALVSLSFLPAAAQSYTVMDLGTLGGNSSLGYAINNRGQVAGYSDGHAFLWSPGGSMRDLGTLGENVSIAYGLNDSAQVVGSSGSDAFLWTKDNGMQSLGTLGGPTSEAYGINNLGQVVGQSELSDGVSSHAFLWTQSGGMQDLGTLGGTVSGAYALNDTGQVVGYSVLADGVTTHAFLWTQGGGMQDIDTLGCSGASAINNVGQVVGGSCASSSNGGSFLWDSTHGMRVLGMPDSAQYSAALGINSSAQIVGQVLIHISTSGVLRTKPSLFTNLNGRISHEHGLITTAFAINEIGQIAGVNNGNHAILLTPIK